MENSMLSFQLANEGREIQIECDEQGMNTLIGALEKIRYKGGHVHLRTPSNGGRELSEKTPWGDDAIGEVVINCNGDA
jgi:hypothetical protein